MILAAFKHDSHSLAKYIVYTVCNIQYNSKRQNCQACMYRVDRERDRWPGKRLKLPDQKQLDPSSRFDTTPACDGQTDGYMKTSYTALAQRRAVKAVIP